MGSPKGWKTTGLSECFSAAAENNTSKGFLWQWKINISVTLLLWLFWAIMIAFIVATIYFFFIIIFPFSRLIFLICSCKGKRTSLFPLYIIYTLCTLIYFPLHTATSLFEKSLDFCCLFCCCWIIIVSPFCAFNYYYRCMFREYGK